MTDKGSSDSPIRLQEMIPKDVPVEPNSMLREMGLDNRVKWGGEIMVVPASMSPEEAMQDLLSTIAQMNERLGVTEFSYEIDFPFYEVLVATHRVLKREFDKVLIPEPSPGKQRQRTIKVQTGLNEFESIESGVRVLADLSNALLGISRYNGVSYLEVTARRDYEDVLDTLVDMIVHEIEEHSIYRGQVIDGYFDFIDLSKFDSGSVVYNSDSKKDLDALLWLCIERSEDVKTRGHNLKRCVLLEGRYGTGKTLTALRTAKLCAANGWTFINAKPGVHSLFGTMEIGRMYGPSVVFFEDIDSMLTDDPHELRELLDQFDGLDTKGNPLIVLMTTNHPGLIPKGMIRPGRIDAVIELKPLDHVGLEELANKVLASSEIDPEINWQELVTELGEMTPAFAVEALKRVDLYMMAGPEDASIVTADNIMSAGKSLDGQLKMMEEANALAHRPEIENALGRVLDGKLQDHRVDMNRGGLLVSTSSSNGHH